MGEPTIDLTIHDQIEICLACKSRPLANGFCYECNMEMKNHEKKG